MPKLPKLSDLRSNFANPKLSEHQLDTLILRSPMHYAAASGLFDESTPKSDDWYDYAFDDFSFEANVFRMRNTLGAIGRDGINAYIASGGDEDRFSSEYLKRAESIKTAKLEHPSDFELVETARMNEFKTPAALKIMRESSWCVRNPENVPTMYLAKDKMASIYHNPKTKQAALLSHTGKIVHEARLQNQTAIDPRSIDPNLRNDMKFSNIFHNIKHLLDDIKETYKINREGAYYHTAWNKQLNLFDEFLRFLPDDSPAVVKIDLPKYKGVMTQTNPGDDSRPDNYYKYMLYDNKRKSQFANVINYDLGDTQPFFRIGNEKFISGISKLNELFNSSDLDSISTYTLSNQAFAMAYTNTAKELEAKDPEAWKKLSHSERKEHIAFGARFKNILKYVKK